MTSWCLCSGEGTQCRVDEEKVKKRLVLLLKYLDHKETLELQALYALQTLVHRLEHPPSKHFSMFYISFLALAVTVVTIIVNVQGGLC